MACQLFARQRMFVRMATTFAVLADPTRRRILDVLPGAERRVGEPVDITARSRPVVSTHLRVRRRAGLAEVSADAQRTAYPGPIGTIARRGMVARAESPRVGVTLRCPRGAPGPHG